MKSHLFQELTGNGVSRGKSAPGKQESRLAKEEGGRVHRRSGAGWVKWDGSSKGKLWDAKHTDGDSIRLPISMLAHLERDSVCQGKMAFFELEFSNHPSSIGPHWYLMPMLTYFSCGGGKVSQDIPTIPVKGSSLGVSVSRLVKASASHGMLVFDVPSLGQWVVIPKSKKEQLQW
jgi:hypothetical protein